MNDIFFAIIVFYIETDELIDTSLLYAIQWHSYQQHRNVAHKMLSHIFLAESVIHIQYNWNLFGFSEFCWNNVNVI